MKTSDLKYNEDYWVILDNCIQKVIFKSTTYFFSYNKIILNVINSKGNVINLYYNYKSSNEDIPVFKFKPDDWILKLNEEDIIEYSMYLADDNCIDIKSLKAKYFNKIELSKRREYNMNKLKI